MATKTKQANKHTIITTTTHNNNNKNKGIISAKGIHFKLLVKMQLTKTTPHASPLFRSLVTYAPICKIFHSRLKINLYHTNRQSKWVHVSFSYLSQGSNSDTDDDTTGLVEDSYPAPPDILQVADELLPSISNPLSIEDGDDVR